MVKAARRVGWYGKLPARGDFLGRGLSARWRSEWDGWLQRGLALAATMPDQAGWRERLDGFAPWRYLALSDPGEAWCGVLVASRDRVGRPFPLTLVERLSMPASPAQCAARLASLLEPATRGPDALEAAIAALPPHPEPDVAAAQTWPAHPASLWWPLAAAQDAAPLAASWPPEPSLVFVLLGSPQPAVS